MLEWLFGRRKQLLKQEITAEEKSLLERAFWQAPHLTAPQREQLIRWVRVFISEKTWEGCNGVEITQSMQWSIAATAGMMVLAYPDWYFDKTATILVHPRPYRVRVDSAAVSNNPILGGEFHRAGETIYRGPVVLNWHDIQAAVASHNQGHHLVIHEFAHQLDMINGPAADGLPPLPGNVNEDSWRTQMRAEYEVARDMVGQGHNILMDDYGLTHESEFFAVASELYFQLPHELREYHPNVFKLLKQFYVIDMALTLGD